MDTCPSAWVSGSRVRNANTTECSELARGTRTAACTAQSTGQGNSATEERKRLSGRSKRFFRREPSEVNKNERMKFIAFKTADGTHKGNISFYCRLLHVTRQRFYQYLGSTDKFGTTILTHLFCPHFGGKSSTEHHSASGFPPRSDEKSTPIWQTSFYQ